MPVNVSIREMRTAPSVGLIGACVGRDFKTALFTQPHRSAYLWRVGTLSLMSPAPSTLAVTSPDVDKATLLTLERDINKTFDLPAVLDQPYIVMDFFRDLYAALVLRDGRVITNGMEVQKHGAAKLGLDVADRIEAYSPRFPGLWIESFRKFCEFANRSKAQFLIVPVYQLAVFWHDGVFSVDPGWRPKQILRSHGRTSS